MTPKELVDQGMIALGWGNPDDDQDEEALQAAIDTVPVLDCLRYVGV